MSQLVRKLSGHVCFILCMLCLHSCLIRMNWTDRDPCKPELIMFNWCWIWTMCNHLCWGLEFQILLPSFGPLLSLFLSFVSLVSLFLPFISSFLLTHSSLLFASLFSRFLVVPVFPQCFLIAYFSCLFLFGFSSFFPSLLSFFLFYLSS